MLHYEVRLKTERIPTFIICAFILHNVAKYLKDPDDFSDLLSEDNEQSNPEIIEELNPRHIRQEGEIRRNHIAEILHQRRRNESEP